MKFRESVLCLLIFVKKNKLAGQRAGEKSFMLHKESKGLSRWAREENKLIIIQEV